MLVLGAAGTALFLLPYLHEIYYGPLRSALGQTNVQIGSLSSVYGAASLVGYLPGGWLADRFAPRTLIPFGLIGTGLGGFIFASFPPYPIALLLYAFWGAMTVVCWSALIRATREWAPAEKQGRAFGLLEGVRGATEGAIGAGGVALFAWAGSTSGALGMVICTFATLNITLGVMAFVMLDRAAPATTTRTVRASTGARILTNPDVWLVAFIVLTSYTAYTALYYFTPYSTDVLRLSVATAGAIAVAKIWLKPVAALLGGLAAEKFGVSQTLTAGFVILTASIAALAVIPGSAGNTTVLIAILAGASVAVFAIRAVYFALLEDCGVCESRTGAATGLISLVGFTPDIFAPPVAGLLLDHFADDVGYRLFFGIAAAACTMGTIASLLVGHRTRARRERANAASTANAPQAS